MASVNRTSIIVLGAYFLRVGLARAFVGASTTNAFRQGVCFTFLSSGIFLLICDPLAQVHVPYNACNGIVGEILVAHLVLVNPDFRKTLEDSDLDLFLC